MYTIKHRNILNAAIHADDLFASYKSHILGKGDLGEGIGISFDTFGELGAFLTRLGANATYAYHDRNSVREEVTPDDANLFAGSLQVDPYGSGIMAYFPGWEFDYNE